MRFSLLMSAVLCCICSSTAALAQQQDGPSTADAFVKHRVSEIWTAAQTGSNLDTALSDSNTLFRTVIAWAKPESREAFREAAFMGRLMGHMSAIRDAEFDHTEVLTKLYNHPKLARELALTVTFADNKAGVYRIIDQIITERGNRIDLERYRNLAVAIAVVYDEPFEWRMNENTVRSNTPLDVFDFYVSHEQHMQYGLTTMPTELLIFVVDSPAPIGELRWALNEFHGKPVIDQYYRTVTYDYDHVIRGKQKKVTKQGLTLQNIRAYGGVCVDQAYYAATIGKAIGVPTTYTVARSGTSGHAWVGYLKIRGSNATWDFDTGRYEAYQSISGLAKNPQHHEPIADNEIAILAESIGASEEQRHFALSSALAVLYLNALQTEGKSFDVPDHAFADARATPRDARDPVTRLELLEAGLRTCPGNRYGWEAFDTLAIQGGMTLEQKREWAEIVTRLCGDRYPDFVFARLVNLINSVEDLDAKLAMWDKAAPLFANRKDLSAGVLFQQGEALEAAGEYKSAGRIYQQVIRKHVNDGPFALSALARTEQMLMESGNGRRIPQLYEQAWKATKMPPKIAPEFILASNWNRIGQLYVKRLREAGNHREADRVAKTLKQRIS